MKKQAAQPVQGHVYRIWHPTHGHMTVEVVGFEDAMTVLVEVAEAPVSPAKPRGRHAYRPPKEGETTVMIWTQWVSSEDVTP